MGYKERTTGGGPARGLGEDFTGFLQNFINSGSFGTATTGQQANAANPMGSTAGIFGLLNSLVSNPATDKAVQETIRKQGERDVNSLRSRFGTSGGTAFGSPAAFAENQYRAEAAPREALAMNELAMSRLQSLMPFFGMAEGVAHKGISQAETNLEPPGWMQALNTGIDIFSAAAPFLFPGGGTAAGLAGGAARPPGVQTTINRPINPAVRTPQTRLGGYKPDLPFQFMPNFSQPQMYF